MFAVSDRLFATPAFTPPRSKTVRREVPRVPAAASLVGKQREVGLPRAERIRPSRTRGCRRATASTPILLKTSMLEQ